MTVTAALSVAIRPSPNPPDADPLTPAIHDGLSGEKAWTTHGGHADYYQVMARTSDARRAISRFLVPADADGLTADPPERRMGLNPSPTATLCLDGVRIPANRRIGEEGDGLAIALAALDSGRLGIAAVATGLAGSAGPIGVGWLGSAEVGGTVAGIDMTVTALGGRSQSSHAPRSNADLRG